MNWFFEALVSALAYGSAYTAAYYPVSMKNIFSVPFNCCVKVVGLLVSVFMLFFVSSRKERTKVLKELRHVFRQPALYLSILACSILWFSAEALFYEATKIADSPAQAAAIWNLSPIPVLLMSKLYYGNTFTSREMGGLGVIMLGVYLINL